MHSKPSTFCFKPRWQAACALSRKLQLFGPDLTEKRGEMLGGFTDRATELANLTLDTDLSGADTRLLSQVTYVLALVTPEESQRLA